MPPKKKIITDGSPDLSATGPVEETLGIDQFELPKSIVGRLAKGSLPGPVSLQKEVPLALVKGSSVFINYLASSAQDIANDNGQKTINANHVLEAVKALGWEDGPELVKLLKSELSAYRKLALAKKASGVSTTRAAPLRPEGTAPKKRGRKSGAELAAIASAKGGPSQGDAEVGEGEGEKEGGDEMAGVTKIVDDGPGAEEEEVYKDGEEEDDGIYEEEEDDEEEEEEEEEEEQRDVGLQDDDEMVEANDDE